MLGRRGRGAGRTLSVALRVRCHFPIRLSASVMIDALSRVLISLCSFSVAVTSWLDTSGPVTTMMSPLWISEPSLRILSHSRRQSPTVLSPSMQCTFFERSVLDLAPSIAEPSVRRWR